MNRFFFLFIIGSLFCSCSGKSGLKDGKSIEGRGIACDSGMVVSAHQMSSAAGVEVLQKGGNAVDAAVATEFALAVCYPEAGNIGGGGFMLIRTNDGATDLIDYREKAPGQAQRNMYLDKSGNVIEGLSTSTALASGVPGTVAGMIKAHSKYGKLPFSIVIQPAIDLAEKGFRITKSQAGDLNRSRQQFIDRNLNRTAFVKDSLWKEGDILVQPDLAQTLKRIQANGKDGFYSGKTAHLILKEMDRSKGIISQTDLDTYSAESRIPLTVDYHGYHVITAPPPSGGGTILIELLKMVEPFSLGNSGFHTARSIHIAVEAERRAFADRAEYMGDPGYMKLTPEELTSSKYILSRMQDFTTNKASLSSDIKAGNPLLHESEETTHYSVVDSWGNSVSATTTLNGTFGSCIVPDSAGFLLNNQMDDFSVKPGFPNMYGLVGGEVNAVQPGKRMLSSMTPVIVEKDGKLFLVAGSPGGSTIPTTVFQVLVNIIDFGMPVLEAVDAGRFHHQWLPDQLVYETGSLDSVVVRQLTGLGHQLIPRAALGRVNAILVNEQGVRYSGADKRGDNSACGY